MFGCTRAEQRLGFRIATCLVDEQPWEGIIGGQAALFDADLEESNETEELSRILTHLLLCDTTT